MLRNQQSKISQQAFRRLLPSRVAGSKVWIIGKQQQQLKEKKTPTCLEAISGWVTSLGRCCPALAGARLVTPMSSVALHTQHWIIRSFMYVWRLPKTDCNTFELHSFQHLKALDMRRRYIRITFSASQFHLAPTRTEALPGTRCSKSRSAIFPPERYVSGGEILFFASDFQIYLKSHWS